MTEKTKGIFMILSPAKTLDLSLLDDEEAGGADATTTIPECDLAKTKQVIEAMKKRKEGELGKLLGISANLAKTAHEYWRNMEVDVSKRDTSDVKPCIYSFSGTAYNGLEASTLDAKSLDYLQNHLRIIDPLYGLLRPLDVMQPYRLEMATRSVFPNDKTMKLSTFWQTSVTANLSDDLTNKSKNKILLNLASDEYSAAVNQKEFPKGAQFVKVVFREEGRVVAVHAKRARGLMARYLSQMQATSLDDVKAFNIEGYLFDEVESDDKTLVFDRKKQTAEKRAASDSSKATSASAGTKKQASKKRRSR